MRPDHPLALAVLACSLTVGAAHAADITSGNASLNVLEGFQLGQFLPFNAPQGDGALKLEGSSSPDVLYKYCWWYRTPISGDNFLFSELKAPAVRTIAGDTLTYSWTDNGNGPAAGGGRFDATLTIRLIDGELPGQGRVDSQLRIRNINTAATTLRFYHLVDIDLPGGAPNPGPDDALSIANPAPLEARYTESSSADYALVSAPGATTHRIDAGLALRTLVNGTVSDLTPETGPYAGDGAVAFQWTLTLAPGEEQTIRSTLAINQPIAPPACRADFNGVGGVTVQDIFDFLVAYFAGQPAADINNAGGVTVQDIFDYLVLYFAGCP